MSAVATIKPHLASMTAPDALRNLPGWLIWRLEHHKGEPKPRKVPYYTNGGRRHGVQGRPEDRQQLTTFDAAKAAAARRGFDGVGFCTLSGFGVVALDFDGCVNNGGVHPEVERVIAGTYAEYSPSGTGVRAFFTGESIGNRKSNEPTQPYGFETFSTKGFVTFTGNRMEITDLLGVENTLVEVTDDVRELCAQRFKRKESDLPEFDPDDPLMAYEPVLGLSEDQIRECLDVLPLDLPYDDWIGIGMAIHHETGGERFDLWDEWSSSSPKYSTSDYGRMKWESFGRNGERPVTARSLVKLANEHGARIDPEMASMADFDVVASEPPAENPTKDLRFKKMSVAQFAEQPAPQWIIKGVLPRAELVVLFGESGSGKTFAALDLAAAIGRGIEWRGHRVKQGHVVYICAEGAGGFRNRVKAYAAHNNVSLADIPIDVILSTPNLLQKADAVDVARSIGRADVVIIDTFAQTTPGANENAAEDMGKALAHCKGIHRATGATVVLVHHAGKDLAKGARGWSGLKAAADAEIEVSRQDPVRCIRTSKQKDGEEGLQWFFDLKEVPIGMDDDGDVITSCVMDYEVEAPVKGKKDMRLGEWEKLVLDVVNHFGEAQQAGIEKKAVVDEAVRRHKAAGGEDARCRDKCSRAVGSLAGKGFFVLEEGCIDLSLSAS